MTPPKPYAVVPAKLSRLIEESKARVAAMTPAERAAMFEAQRQSWAMSFAPCDHGIADWETCPDCRRAALEASNE